MKSSISKQLKALKTYLMQEKGTVKIQKKELLEKDAEINRLKTLVTKDELTGVLNRRGFMEEMERIYSDICYTQKNKETKRRLFIDTIAILYIDVDNFKKANDIYGHSKGDKVLKDLIIIFEKETRKIDFIGRLGGDEFTIALVGSSMENAFYVAEKIRKCVEKKIKLPKKKGIKKISKITISTGVVSSKNSKSLKNLIDRADKAMYEAKHDYGGNKVVKYLG